MIGLWIEGKKYKFDVDLGWYGGEPFVLFKIEILNFYDVGVCNIFNFQIAKFSISLSAYSIED